MVETVHAETKVERPPAEVFHLLSDPHRLRDWLPGVTKVSLARAGDVGKGSHRTVRVEISGVEVESEQEIVEFDVPKRYGWKHLKDEVNGKPFGAIEEIHTTFSLAADAGGTRVKATVRLRPKGLKAKLALPLVKRDIERQVRLAMENLKSAVESEPPPKPRPAGRAKAK